jgi:HPt (histidine-containing phosphotransfer) domain-containing protein
MLMSTDDQYKQKCIDVGYLKNLTKGNTALMKEIVRTYLNDSPKLLKKIREAVDNADWEMVAKGAHTIIPSFTVMGIDREYAQMANKIQEYAEQSREPKIIEKLFQEIEEVCSRARKELEEELRLLETK